MEKFNPNEAKNPLDPGDEIWFVILQDMEERKKLLPDQPEENIKTNQELK